MFDTTETYNKHKKEQHSPIKTQNGGYVIVVWNPMKYLVH